MYMGESDYSTIFEESKISIKISNKQNRKKCPFDQWVCKGEICALYDENRQCCSLYTGSRRGS